MGHYSEEKKATSYYAMKRQEGILNASYYVKEANLQGLYMYDANYTTFWKMQN